MEHGILCKVNAERVAELEKELALRRLQGWKDDQPLAVLFNQVQAENGRLLRQNEEAQVEIIRLRNQLAGVALPGEPAR